MRIKTTIILLFLLSCTKDIPKEPIVTLSVEYISNQSFLLKGKVNEECFRGFIISSKQNALFNDIESITMGYDVGKGEYSMAIGLERNKTYYVKAWAFKIDDNNNIGYSDEQSFKTW